MKYINTLLLVILLALNIFNFNGNNVKLNKEAKIKDKLLEQKKSFKMLCNKLRNQEHELKIEEMKYNTVLKQELLVAKESRPNIEVNVSSSSRSEGSSNRLVSSSVSKSTSKSNSRVSNKITNKNDIF